jgi:hypothetical protein
VGIGARLARLSFDGAPGLLTGVTILGLIVALFVALAALQILRSRVVAFPDQVVIVGTVSKRRVTAAAIRRVLFRTVSYSGSSRKEVLVVAAEGQLLGRVMADLYREDDLRTLFGSLGLQPTGSWLDVITLGLVDGLSASRAIEEKLAGELTG